MKKILTIIITIILIIFISINITVNKNKKYINNIEKEITNKTKIQDIKLISYNNYHYVIKNKDNIIVLNDNYEIILKDNISNLKDVKGTLIYKNNYLVYETKEIKNNKVIYTYYDAYDNHEINKISIKEEL